MAKMIITDLDKTLLRSDRYISEYTDICETNDNDGVAKWIEKNILLEKG